MKNETEYKCGESVYLRNDPEQNEYLIDEIHLLPKNVIVLQLLSPLGDYIPVQSINVSKERNMEKVLGYEGNKKNEDD
jgi:hypothetical protein